MEFKRLWHQLNERIYRKRLILNEALVPVFVSLRELRHFFFSLLLTLVVVVFIFLFSMLLLLLPHSVDVLCGVWDAKTVNWHYDHVLWSVFCLCLYNHGACSFNELQLRNVFCFVVVVAVHALHCLLFWIFPLQSQTSTTTSSWRSIWISYKRCALRETNHQLLAHPQVFNTVFFFGEEQNNLQLIQNVQIGKYRKFNAINCSNNFNGDENCTKKQINLVRYRLCFGHCQRCTRSHCWTCTSCGSCSSCRAQCASSRS